MGEKDTLIELGLTEAEAKVYMSLLGLGSTLVGPVIKKTGLHRATTYETLQRLIEKGLASFLVKGKKKYFEASAPERLLDVLKEKEEHFLQILPMLSTKKNATEEAQGVTVYSGLKGLRTVFDGLLEELKNKGTYFDFGVSGLFREKMPAYWDLWQKQKKKFGIKSFVIFNESLKKTNPKLLVDYIGKKKFHPETFPSFTDTIIFNDKVALIIWTATPPLAIVVKNKENADSYKNQFKILWAACKN